VNCSDPTGLADLIAYYRKPVSELLPVKGYHVTLVLYDDPLRPGESRKFHPPQYWAGYPSENLLKTGHYGHLVIESHPFWNSSEDWSRKYGRRTIISSPKVSYQSIKDKLDKLADIFNHAAPIEYAPNPGTPDTGLDTRNSNTTGKYLVVGLGPQYLRKLGRGDHDNKLGLWRPGWRLPVILRPSKGQKAPPAVIR
jgi:hypothetical protein